MTSRSVSFGRYNVYRPKSKGTRWGTERKTTEKRTAEISITVLDNAFKPFIATNEISTSDIATFKRELSNVDSSRYMNVAALAQVYLFMKRSGIERDEDMQKAIERGAFNQSNLDIYINPLITARHGLISKRSRGEESQLTIVRIKFAHLFLRYITVILNSRARMAQMEYSQLYGEEEEEPEEEEIAEEEEEQEEEEQEEEGESILEEDYYGGEESLVEPIRPGEGLVASEIEETEL